MYKYLLIVMLLSNLPCMSQSTNDKDILEGLYQAKLVNNYERTEVLKEIKRKEDWAKKNKEKISDDSSGRSLPHYPLQVLQRAKIYSTAGMLSMVFVPDPVNIPKDKEKEVRDRLGLYNEKLLKAKLISPVTFEELSRGINDLSLRSEYEVTDAALFSTEQEYFLAPPQLRKFAQGLLDRRLISKEKFDELMNRSAKGELRKYSEPLEYIDGMVWIDMKDYTGKPEDYLEKFYRKAAGASPLISFDKLAYSISKNTRESSPELVFYDITVSLEKQGKKYRYTSYWEAKSKKLPPNPFVNIPEQFHQVFNKILADQLSPYRLHIVRAFNPRNVERFGVLALTKEQFEGLQWSYEGQPGQYINVSYENFTNKLTQTRIKEAIVAYDSLGLFSHLKPNEKDSAIKEVESAEINYYSDILRHFKGLVFEIDLEYGIDKKQYEKLTKMLAGISKGAFKPTAIIDTYNPAARKPFQYGFTLNGKPYKTTLTQEDDWLDPELFSFIEKAMAEQDKKGMFYTLYPSDGARLIYLTHEQAELLKKRKIIELSYEDVAD